MYMYNAMKTLWKITTFLNDSFFNILLYHSGSLTGVTEITHVQQIEWSYNNHRFQTRGYSKPSDDSSQNMRNTAVTTGNVITVALTLTVKKHFNATLTPNRVTILRCTVHQVEQIIVVLISTLGQRQISHNARQSTILCFLPTNIDLSNCWKIIVVISGTCFNTI